MELLQSNAALELDAETVCSKGTNCHVIREASEISLLWSSGFDLEGVLWGRGMAGGMALHASGH